MQIHTESSGQAASTAVRIRGATRTFAGAPPVPALGPIDLDVAAGDFVAVLGPSGCGKTTLLRAIAGLETPDRGELKVAAGTLEPNDPAGGPTPANRAGRGIGYVFQEPHLLPWRDVVGNVELPLELLGVAAPEREHAALSAIAEVGLADAATRSPAQLSGGMRMRVSLARAMVTRPRLLLMDEPFAALDEITRQGLDDMLREVWRTSGVTVVFVTHSILEATYLARRAVVLSQRPGRIVLDHVLELPAERDAELRTRAAFAEQSGILLHALQRGAGLR